MSLLNDDRVRREKEAQHTFDFDTNEIDVNELGGKQTQLLVRTDLLPPLALLRVSEILYTGAEKYGVDNWRNIDSSDNLNHALTHVLKTMTLVRESGREEAVVQELSQATCRMLFALDMLLTEINEKTADREPD